MQRPKELWRVRIVSVLASVSSLALGSCADEITRPGTASGLTTPPSTAVSARAPVLAAVAAPPTFVFVSRGGVGLLDHDFKCHETSSSVTHAVGSIRRSTGPASSSHTYQFRVTSNTQISYNAHIEVYVVGPPGTRYHIDRFLSASVSASLAPPVSGFDRAKASITNPQIGVDFLGRAGNASLSRGRSDSFDGVSGSRTIPCFGTTYSSVIASGWNIQATVWDYSDESDGARGSAHSTLQASYSGYIPGRDPVPSDQDGDGVPDPIDRCDDTAAGAVVDANGCSQAQLDSDLDGICNPGASSSLCNGSDNCPSLANPTQEDSNQDGVGDACEEPLSIEVAVGQTVFQPVLARCFNAITQTAVLSGGPCTGAPAARTDRTTGEVRVTRGATPIPNQSVTLSSVPIENTGGHGHPNRPRGRFVTVGGSLAPTLTVTTDASGKASFVYQTSGVSGREEVKGELSSGKSDAAPVTIRLFEALGTLVPLNPLWAIKENSDHGGIPNSYLQPGSQAVFDNIVAAYFAEVPESERFQGSPGKFVVTDMSLPEGGLYDWQFTWSNPHKLHRTGQDIDVRITNLHPAGLARLYRICRRYGASCQYEGSPPHLHIYTFWDRRNAVGFDRGG
jgi:hypothetical protein